MSSMFLFGAGASIDGGLADAFSLTENIYRYLQQSNDTEASKVFGLVVAKLIARHVREGGSPFDRINVEDVYDGIQKLAGRSKDILSDFVVGWDPSLAGLRKRITNREIDEAITNFAYQISANEFTRRQTLGSRGSRGLKNVLYKLSEPSNNEDIGSVERSLLRALMTSLKHNDERIGYFREIVDIANSSGGDLATLNYDLIAESSADSIGLSYDYGLGKWNDQKIVGFKRSSPKNIRLIKLHGSLNWFAKDDDIEISDPKADLWAPIPNLVFGGAGNKLRVDGPFLQLRHEFQSRLLSTNTLVIIGYSFQDEHLNSIIRRWTNTRRKGKLIIVNPSPVRTFADAIGLPYKRSDEGRTGDLTVDLIHIPTGAAASIELLRKAIDLPIDLEREPANGLLPHVHFRQIA